MRSKSMSALPCSRGGSVGVEQVEDEGGGPGELLAAVTPPGERVVVLPESLAPAELDDRLPNLFGTIPVPVALETALEHPVQDRPHRPSPVAGRLEARIGRRETGHGPARGADRYAGARQSLDHTLGPAPVGNA